MQSHQKLNRIKWQDRSDWYVQPALENWATRRAKWGIWGTSDRELRLLPEDMSGMTCLEIGCGAAYVSAWIAKRGGLAFGIDPTPNQLATAKKLERQYRTGIHLVEGFGETLPFRDATFDFVISEYGASLWADPYQWLPEAVRVMKPDSPLVFMTDHLISFITADEDENVGQTRKLLRSYFDSYKMRWSEDDGIEFHLTHSAWIELFANNGLQVERLLELSAPDEAYSRYPFANPEWSKRWPSEEVWVVRKRG